MMGGVLGGLFGWGGRLTSRTMCMRGCWHWCGLVMIMMSSEPPMPPPPPPPPPPPLSLPTLQASEQHVSSAGIDDIPPEQLERVFRTNVFGYVFMSKAALPHMQRGASIINTVSVEAYGGQGFMVPYSMTKGAELALTRSLSAMLMSKGAR